MDVDTTRPGFEVWVAAGRRLLLTQLAEPVVFGLVRPYLAGVRYLRTGRFRSPIPALRADLARRLAGDPDRWAHHFATGLRNSPDGPLHPGRWVIAADGIVPHDPMTSTRPHDVLVYTADADEIDWVSHAYACWMILPLRQLNDAGHGRVKAYVKQLNEGIMPPLLLWWISGLNCYVLLDGHDRLAAALAARVVPPRLALSRINVDRAAAETEAMVLDYSERIGHMTRHQAPAATVGREGQALAGNLREINDSHGPTVARQLPGGAAVWDRLATTAGWDLRPG